MGQEGGGREEAGEVRCDVTGAGSFHSIVLLHARAKSIALYLTYPLLSTPAGLAAEAR